MVLVLVQLWQDHASSKLLLAGGGGRCGGVVDALGDQDAVGAASVYVAKVEARDAHLVKVRARVRVRFRLRVTVRARVRVRVRGRARVKSDGCARAADPRGTGRYREI